MTCFSIIFSLKFYQIVLSVTSKVEVIYTAIQKGTQKQIFFLPRFLSSNGHKLLAYQGSKLSTDLPIKLKDQNHLGKFQVELKDNSLNN